MKKILLILGSLLVILIVGIVVALNVYLEPQIKSAIEKNGTEALGAPVKVESVSVQLWPPATIVIKHIKTNFKKSLLGFNVDLGILRMHVPLLDLLSKKIDAEVLLDGPQITVALPDDNDDLAKKAEKPQAEKAAESGPGPAAALAAYSLSLKFTLQKGSINISQALQNSLHLKNLNVDFSFKTFTGPFALKLQTDSDINWKGFKADLPVKLTSDFTFDGQTFESKKTNLSLAGLESQVIGSANLATEMHLWDLTLDIKDLKSLPGLPEIVAKMKPSGSLGAKIHAEHKRGSDWQASGSIQAKSFSANLDLDQSGAVLKGPLSADADVDFVFKKTLSLSKIILHSDLTGTEISYQKQFAKPAKTALVIDVDGSQNADVLDLKKATLVFSSLKGSASGQVASAPGKMSKLDIIVNRTDLSGFEKYFPPLAQTPLQGAVEVKAHLEGDLQQPKTLLVNLNPLKLEKVRGAFAWTSEDKKTLLKGPVSLDALAVVVAKGADLQSANISAFADLSAMDIEYADKLSKKAGSTLKFEIVAAKKGPSIEVKKSGLTTAAGLLSLKGTLKNPQAPDLNLNVSIPRLDLATLSKLVPMMASFGLVGTANGQATLKGTYDFAKGIEKSPLSLQGEANVVIPQFVMIVDKKAEASKAEAEKKAVAVKKKPEPLLPDWPIMRNLTLRTSASLGKFQRGYSAQVDPSTLVVNKIDWKGFITGGRLSGTATVGQIFGGSAKVTKIGLPLLIPAPTTELTAVANGVDLQAAVTWVSPEWKELIRGRATGQVDMRAAHPSRDDFLDATWVKGELAIKDGFLSTLPFDQIIRTKLAGLPGVGDKAKAFSSKGATANIWANFEYTKSQLNFSKFNVVTPENNEMQSTGYAKLDKTFDLKGRVFIKDAPVGGDIMAANADPSGRLMLDVHCSGNVFKPDCPLADETAKNLLGRTATYRGNIVKKQAEERAKAEGQKVMEQQKNKLQEEAKKLLKF